MESSKSKLMLYVDLIRTLALEDPSLQDLVDELTLGSIMTEIARLQNQPLLEGNSGDLEALPDSPKICGVIHENDLLTYGVSARYHLNLSTRRRMFQELQKTLRSIAEFFYGDQEALANQETDFLTKLPEILQTYKIETEDKKREVTSSSQRVAELIAQINKARQRFDSELQQAVLRTLPAYGATRTSSIDLLAATIEAALIKISLIRAHAERALYNYQSPNGAFGEGANVAGAIEAAYVSLKRDEKEMKMQNQSLDRQLQEYESLMQLVDGGKNGYQQIINDWTKVQQETDECLKDLRRLGWTGD